MYVIQNDCCFVLIFDSLYGYNLLDHVCVETRDYHFYIIVELKL